MSLVHKINKLTVIVDGVAEKITPQQATMIYQYLIKNDYVFNNSDIIRIYAEPFAYNIASCKVLENAG